MDDIEKIYIECPCGFVGVTFSERSLENKELSAEDENELEDEKDTCPKCMREITPIEDDDKIREIDELSKTRKKGVVNFTGEEDDE